MQLLIDNSFLTDEQKIILEDVFESGVVPFYYTSNAVYDGDNGVHFIHHVVRSEKSFSPLFDIFKGILDSFTKNNNIVYNVIHRIAINVTFNNGQVYKCPVHKDHNFNHKQLILYLNDSSGDTMIETDSGDYIPVMPEKYKGVCFNNVNHYHYFPVTGVRRIAVFTFS